jgi:hypothetical protein
VNAYKVVAMVTEDGEFVWKEWKMLAPSKLFAERYIEQEIPGVNSHSINATEIDVWILEAPPSKGTAP